MPSPDRLAVHKLAKLAGLYQDNKTLCEVAKGHPVALVHGRAGRVETVRVVKTP